MPFRTLTLTLAALMLAACGTTSAPQPATRAPQSGKQQCLESLASMLEVTVYADYCVRGEQQRRPFFEFAHRAPTQEPLASCRGMLTVQEAGALRSRITAPYAADPARHCAAVQGNMHQLMRCYGIAPAAR